jgi:hypothetical protein
MVGIILAIFLCIMIFLVWRAASNCVGGENPGILCQAAHVFI